MIQPMAPLWTEQVYQDTMGSTHIYMDRWV